MEGDLNSEEFKGIIPRAVEVRSRGIFGKVAKQLLTPWLVLAQAIFDRLGDKGKYVSSNVKASYLEIYNEELSDLLFSVRCEHHALQVSGAARKSLRYFIYNSTLSPSAAGPGA